MYSFDGLPGGGSGGGGEKNNDPTRVRLSDVRHGPATVASPSSAIRQTLPTSTYRLLLPTPTRQRRGARFIFFLLMRTSFRLSYCRLNNTRISPFPAANGSSALPISVPGRCMRIPPPTFTGTDFIATPSLSLVTSRSPILIGPLLASTFTFTRPVDATSTRPSPASPRTTPGCREITPATRLSWDCVEAITWFDCAESRTTTVPGGSSCEESTHSATSWYFALMLPSTVILPATWSLFAGVGVPMPKLPAVSTTILKASAV